MFPIVSPNVDYVFQIVWTTLIAFSFCAVGGLKLILYVPLLRKAINAKKDVSLVNTIKLHIILGSILLIFSLASAAFGLYFIGGLLIGVIFLTLKYWFKK